MKRLGDAIPILTKVFVYGEWDRFKAKIVGYHIEKSSLGDLQVYYIVQDKDNFLYLCESSEISE